MKIVYIVLSLLLLMHPLPSLFAQEEGPLVKQVYTLYRPGDYQGTIKKIDQLFKVVGDQWGMGHYLKGSCYLKLKDHKRAEQSFLKATKKRVVPKSALYQYAQILYSNNQLDRSKQLFSSAINREFEEVNALYYIAHINQLQENYPQAIAGYQSVSSHPKASKEIRQVSSYQIAKVQEEKIEGMAKREDKKRYLRDTIIPQMKLAIRLAPESKMAQTIKGDIRKVKVRHGLTYKDGRPIKDYNYGFTFLSELSYDTNITLEADDAANEQQTKEASPVSKNELVGKYSYNYNGALVMMPEVRLTFDYHGEQDNPNIYQNDNYIVGVYFKNRWKYKLGKLPASHIFDLDYNYQAKDYQSNHSLDEYSNSYTMTVGEDIKLFAIGSSKIKFKYKNYSGYTTTLDSNTYTLHLSQIYKLPKREILIFTLNLDFNQSNVESSSTNSYMARADYIGFKLYRDIKLDSALAITLVDTLEQSSIRGTETLFAPSLRLVKPFAKLFDGHITSKLALKYNFSKKLSKSSTIYAYTKHVVALEFQMRM